MNTLRFSGISLRELRAGMLGHAPNEGAAIVLAERIELGTRTDFLVREVWPVPDEYVQATPLSIEIAPEFIARVMKRGRLSELSLFFAHSHPLSNRAMFSAIDDAGEERLMPSVFQRIARGPHGAIVLTPTDCTGRAYATPDRAPERLRIVEVGDDIRAYPATLTETEALPETADRTVRALGETGQRRLAGLAVGIVGLGGMGSLVAEQLAHLGVRRFVLLDPDVVDATNLNRVVGASHADVGRNKVDVAARLIGSIHKGANVLARVGDVRFEADARMLLDLDIIFCCTDSHGSRAILNQLAQQYYIPVFDTGVRIDAHDGRITYMVGRTQLLAPGRPCLVCEGLLDPEEVRRDLLSDEERKRDPYIVGAQEPQPAVISLNGVVASLTVTMLLGAACGLPVVTRHQIYMADKGVVRNVASDKNPQCFVCGADGAFGRGDRWNVPWRRG